MSGMEIIALAGLGASIGGQIMGASAQANAMEQSAKLKNLQANEMMDRLAINEQSISDQAQLDRGHITASFASRGGEGAGIGAILNYNKILLQNISNNRRETEFKANMLRMGASIEADQASSARTAGFLSAGGSLLSAGVQAYNIYKGPSKSTPLYSNVTPMVPGSNSWSSLRPWATF